MTLAYSFAASFILIFFRAFQQRNIVASRYKLMVPTSMAMTFAEVYIIATAAAQPSLTLACFIGAGGGCGAILATLASNRLFK